MSIQQLRTLWFGSALIVVLFASSSIAAAPPGQVGPRNLSRGALPAAPDAPINNNRTDRAPVRDQAPIQEMIEGFYVSRFQQELGLDDEQFVRLLPSLRESLAQRNQLSIRHNRTLRALDQAPRDGAPDSELNRLIALLDESDREIRNVQENLLRNVDPALTPRQRARFRIVQPNVENRIRNLIERSRNAENPAPQRAQPNR